VCEYCREWEQINQRLAKNLENSQAYFDDLTTRLGRRGQRGYDSILGLSGGVDSSYSALVAKRLGLNPLLVHLDNGWNSEIAVSNIKKIARACQFDLDTYVIDWAEFRDLQRAFFKASVIDIEMLSDHAIFAVLLKLARKHGIRTVLSGNNYATEFGMPQSWVWNKQDFTNIKAIHRQFGEVKLRTYPVLTSWKFIAITKLGYGMEYVEILNHLPYRKALALQELEKEFDWVYYGGKHYESTFTKFYQTYVLPVKFGVDKRRAHLSSLIRNREITREEALETLKELPYDKDTIEAERDFVLKKLGFSLAEFESMMAEPPKPHLHYASDHHKLEVLRQMVQAVRTWKSKLSVGSAKP
jgi:N-acetyl sugar amidotransferase